MGDGRVLWGVVFLAMAQAMANAAPRVAVLANADDPDSVALARYYIQARGLAEDSLVALPMAREEEISWDTFIGTIWDPLLGVMIERGWIFGAFGGGRDPVGRRSYVSTGHKLDALVVCRGVPLRVAHDPARLDPTSHPLGKNPQLNTTIAAVDSELAMLAAGGHPLVAFVPNPLFNEERPGLNARELFLPVGRLDGPTAEDARALVDHALAAERDGLIGRAYLDVGGPHRQGDDWLEACAPELERLGFDYDVERSQTLLGAWSRFDAPALYFGWYRGDIGGAFDREDFIFPPGAIAIHIHSFSALTLRSRTQGWTGPLVARGVTATVGNVAEPYLEFTHRPQLFLRALARGEPLGRAALYSLNALSWQAILVGDPLYRPFAVDTAAQRARAAELPPALAPYVGLRAARLRAAEDGATPGAGRAEAWASLQAQQRREPSLAIALSLATWQHAAGETAAARRSLAVFDSVRRPKLEERALMLAATRLHVALGDKKSALWLTKLLVSDPTLSGESRRELLPVAADLAAQAGEPKVAALWRQEHEAAQAPAAPAAP
jgi:uncharacterized protein (TIGR03790 family)